MIVQSMPYPAATPFTTAWKSPGTITNQSYEGSTNWLSVTSADASDDAWATSGLGAGGQTRHLRATNFGFTTADIPSGATITGIEVQIERHATATGISDLAVLLVNGTALSTADHKGGNKASADIWPTTDAYKTYGGAGDTWAAGLTDADLRGANFGVTLRAQASATANARVDHIRIRVHGTAP